MDVDVDWLRRLHLKRGWSDVGYHFIVRRDGSIEQGRPLHKQGAHVRGHNVNTIGICYVGGVGEDRAPEDNITKRQMRSVTKLVESLKLCFPDIQKFCGHNDFEGVKKACPSFSVKAKFPALTRFVQS